MVSQSTGSFLPSQLLRGGGYDESDWQHCLSATRNACNR